MTRFLRRTAAALATAALAVPLLASSALAQPAAPARPDIGARITEMTAGLSLTPDQQARLAEVSARYRGQADPAALWLAAADVQRELTPEQTASLSARRAADRTERRDRASARRGAGRSAERRTEAATQDPARAARRAEGRAIAEAFKPQMQALVAGLRAGQISDADFERQARALRAEAQAQRDALLTPDERQRVAESRARREAATVARQRALGLTDAQQEAARALAIERIRTAPERSDAAERRQRVETGQASREALRARAEQILTPEQRAVEAVYRALGGGRGPGRAGMRRGDVQRGDMRLDRRGRRGPAGRPVAPRGEDK